MEKNISKIEIKVELDNNKVPEKIRWTASDGNINNQETKATFLSVWDSKNKESLRIDLWTKDMPLDEMKLFFYLKSAVKMYLKTELRKFLQKIVNFNNRFVRFGNRSC